MTNFGTTEHLGEQLDVDASELRSAQFEAFRNLHRLAKPYGLIMNMLPLKGCWPAHGVLEYELSFFEALAGADFDVVLIDDKDHSAYVCTSFAW